MPVKAPPSVTAVSGVSGARASGFSAIKGGGKKAVAAPVSTVFLGGGGSSAPSAPSDRKPSIPAMISLDPKDNEKLQEDIDFVLAFNQGKETDVDKLADAHDYILNTLHRFVRDAAPQLHGMNRYWDDYSGCTDKNKKIKALEAWLVLSTNVKSKITESEFDEERKGLLLSYMESEGKVVEDLITKINPSRRSEAGAGHAMAC